MKVFAICLDGRDTVSCWIARNEDWKNAILAMLGGDFVYDGRHLVKLFWADVRTIREAKLLLFSNVGLGNSESVDSRI